MEIFILVLLFSRLANRKSQHKVDTAKGTNKCVSKSG